MLPRDSEGSADATIQVWAYIAHDPVPLPLWSRAHSSLELGLNPVHIETQLKPASSRPGSALFLGNRTQTGFQNSVFNLEYRNSVYLKSWNWVLIRLIFKVSSNPVQPDRVLCLCLGTGFKPGFQTGFSTGVIQMWFIFSSRTGF